jgi:hypothetical protein
VWESALFYFPVATSSPVGSDVLTYPGPTVQAGLPVPGFKPTKSISPDYRYLDQGPIDYPPEKTIQR